MKTIEQAARESADKAWGELDEFTSDKDGEFHYQHTEAFKAGVEFAQRWIPVEREKPKANTIVLIIAITETGKRYRTVAYFIPTKTVLADDFLESGYDSEDLQEYDDELDEYWVKEGWFEYQTVAEIHWHISDKITHWLPIPKLPSVLF